MLKCLGLSLCTAALVMAGSFAGADAQNQPQSGVKAGTLMCDVSSGWGVIFGSSRDLRCTYQSIKGTIEQYSGHISKYGVDIGYTHRGVIIWAVFAPTSDMAPGSLAGDYAGATAGATLVVGAGVHALVGGLKKSISLQPVSIEGNTGLNVAAGVATVTLTHGH